MSAVYAVTAKATVVLACCVEGMFEPGLANLFKALGIIGAATHPIQILRNHRVVINRQSKPIQIHGAGITRSCSDTEPDIVSIDSKVWRSRSEERRVGKECRSLWVE